MSMSMSATLNHMRAEASAESVFEHFSKDKTACPALFNKVTRELEKNPKLEITLKQITKWEKALVKKAEVVVVSAPISDLVTAFGATRAELEKNLATMTVALGTALSDMISVPLCWSSRRMTELMNWRNPQVEAKPTVLRSIINITKRAVTEVALPFLAVTAAVETVATQALILGAKVLQPISKRPLNYLNSTRVPGINQSARFTALWTVANLWHNVREKALPILELDARNILFKGYFKLGT
ncbi:MAG: hypothetical protein JSR37_04630 [Verrucomicrobia bacterium]|nr:hypothetical protein [Verrucomicrobiota bacterium]